MSQELRKARASFCAAISICRSTALGDIFKSFATSSYFKPSSRISLNTIMHLGGSMFTAR